MGLKLASEHSILLAVGLQPPTLPELSPRGNGTAVEVRAGSQRYHLFHHLKNSTSRALDYQSQEVECLLKLGIGIDCAADHRRLVLRVPTDEIEKEEEPDWG